MPEMTDRNFIMEPERRIPVSGTADVIVCGGGPAGVCAAVAAAASVRRPCFWNGEARWAVS